MDILNKVKSFYETAVKSKSYTSWLEQAKEAHDFYDGEQWTAEEKEALMEKGQPAIVINKIANKIDNLAGTEISGRTRILFRSRSGEKREEETARALSDLALYVAEKNEQATAISNVFKEGLITGISWLDTGVMRAEEGTHIFNQHENTFNVIWDPYFTKNDYSDARFVCRERWMDSEQLKAMFAEKTDGMLTHLNDARHAINLSTHTYGDAKDISYFDTDSERFRVIEVQYKKTEKRYLVTTLNGATFSTFDKDVAFANPEFDVETDFLPRVYIAYYSDNTLLAHYPSPYQHNYFTLIPYVFKREKRTGVPYGIMRHAIDPQRELNKRRSKAMHMLNTAQVIADVDAVENPAVLAREAARPDGVILKRPGKELRILRNTDLAASQVSVMEGAARDIQETTGVFDESIGKHSNATSGVAIQQRQMAGSLNQMFAFDALRKMKKQLGHMLLSYIRQHFTTEMVVQITDNLSAPRSVRLNQTVLDAYGKPLVTKHGEAVKVNDVTTGIFDIVVDEVKDVLSSRELELNQLNMLITAGVPVPPHVLVEATNLSNKKEILDAISPPLNDLGEDGLSTKKGVTHERNF